MTRSTESAEWRIDGPQDARWTIALAHGAGVGMDAPFMETFATGLAAKGLRVIRFEFPYMREWRRTGSQRPPNREPVLLESWREVVAAADTERLVIGGKSLGGRIASLLADEVGAAGLVCLGYPFHPPGKPETLRTEHLASLRTPTLLLQGTRDPFGTRQEVEGYSLSSSVRLHWLEDGEHSFKPRKSSGRTEAENWQEGIDAIVAFVGGLEV